MKWFSKFSLSTKLLIIVIVFFILPFTCIFFTSYSISEKIIYNKIDQANNSVLEQLNSNLSELFDDMRKTSEVMQIDKKVEGLLNYYNGYAGSNSAYLYSNTNDNTLSDIDKLNIYKEFDHTFSSMVENLLYPNSKIGIYTLDGNYFSNWSSGNTRFSFFQNNKWFEKAEKLVGIPFYTGPHESYVDYDNRKYVSYIKMLYAEGNLNRKLGFLIISIPIDNLNTIIKNSEITSLSTILVLDNEGKLITGEGSELEIYTKDIYKASLDKVQGKTGRFTTKINKGSSLVNYNTIAPLNWKVVSIIPYDTMFSEIRWLRYTVVTLNLIVLISFSILAIMLIYKITKPLKALKRSMEKVKSGDLNILIKGVNSNDEIGVLYSTFNSMLSEIRGLIEKISEDKKRESELRFEMLMAQINPHFLFNTLNSIKWMALMSRATNVSDTISALGRLLEISMNKQSDVITINEEIENVKSYVLIQKTRYKENFDIDYNIENEIMSYGTLKLILQPLVENAIIHNLEEVESSVSIKIIGRKIDSIIELVVEDNGNGITDKIMNNLLDPEEKFKDQKVFKGIGVSNVDERIKLKFGEQYGISVKSDRNFGTSVKIIFPFFEL